MIHTLAIQYLVNHQPFDRHQYEHEM
jgi:hypothetical protein